tara:strand:+ start:61 stop:369 length:309 start_codon:yes stop_codon:yes gene_type:complete
MFKVIGTTTYVEEIKKWPKSYRDEAEKIPKKLSMNPLSGNQLSYKFLREKRIKEKRIYFLVYEDLQLVLLVATSGKKNQRATINHIKEHLDKFKKVAIEITK